MSAMESNSAVEDAYPPSYSSSSFAETQPGSKTPSKSRSFSDPANAQQNALPPSTLAPSPNFLERASSTSKDDHALPTTPQPRASRRPDFLSRGLSLQMPPTSSTFSSSSMPSPSHFPRPAPLSPQLDPHNIYMHSQQQSLQASPATSLPRHSRGLDFARACSTLHHSTLAEQSSPDSSPVILQRGMMIPGVNGRKGSMGSMMLDSPNLNGAPNMPWGSLAPERSTVSSSVGSVNMLVSESDSSGSDDDASMVGDEHDDPIYTTPQVHKLQNPNAPTPFASNTPGAGTTWLDGNAFSPARQSLLKNMRRARLQKTGRRSRKGSSSASNSGYSSLASPRTASPPPMRSIESSSAANGNGYFYLPTAARSRRESLALGTDGLHISSGNDSGDEASNNTTPSTPGVVRRPVTRRGNLLPKTKGFARIRAALQEEAAPVDSEVRREAETIRQVRERDTSFSGDLPDLSYDSRPQTATASALSSPNLLPAVPESISEDFTNSLHNENDPDIDATPKGLGVNFSLHANRNSGGLNYWNRFDAALMRTPPPPPSFARNASSAGMSDVNMDSDSSTPLGAPLWRRPRGRSSASDASDAFMPPTGGTAMGAGVNDDMHIKKFKRRRDAGDDGDVATIKRRAVSPGMSAQNSPVLHSLSPREEAGKGWGGPPERKEKGAVAPPSSAGSEGPGLGRREGSGGSLASGSGGVGGTATPSGGKKLGLQGMTDTNDGLMKMSIE